MNLPTFRTGHLRHKVVNIANLAPALEFYFWSFRLYLIGNAPKNQIGFALDRSQLTYAHASA